MYLSAALCVCLGLFAGCGGSEITGADDRVDAGDPFTEADAGVVLDGGPGSVDARPGDADGFPPPPPPGTYELLPESNGSPLFAANDSELTARLSSSHPGQHIVLTGAQYSAARTLGDGKVVVNLDLNDMPRITGDYSLDGADATVYGLDFDSARVTLRGDRARVARSKIHHTSGSPVVILDGEDAVVAYSEIYHWGELGDCGAARGIVIRAPLPNGSDGTLRPDIFRNYLHDQVNYNPETCSSDGEVIAVGQTSASGRAKTRLAATIHHNYLVDVAGDNEGIGVKGSYSIIAFNHLVGARGLNNRFGGFNLFIGNRAEAVVGGGLGFHRTGYCNVSLGEVIDGSVIIDDGDTYWTDPDNSKNRLRSDSVEIAATTYDQLSIGERYEYGPYDAIDTWVRAGNKAPLLGSEHSGTIDEWDQPSPYSVPPPASLTTADVGVHAAGGGTTVPLDDFSTYVDEVNQRPCAQGR